MKSLLTFIFLICSAAAFAKNEDGNRPFSPCPGHFNSRDARGESTSSTSALKIIRALDQTGVENLRVGSRSLGIAISHSQVRFMINNIEGVRNLLISALNMTKEGPILILLTGDLYKEFEAPGKEVKPARRRYYENNIQKNEDQLRATLEAVKADLDAKLPPGQKNRFVLKTWHDLHRDSVMNEIKAVYNNLYETESTFREGVNRLAREFYQYRTRRTDLPSDWNLREPFYAGFISSEAGLVTIGARLDGVNVRHLLHPVFGDNAQPAIFHFLQKYARENFSKIEEMYFKRTGQHLPPDFAEFYDVVQPRPLLPQSPTSNAEAG